jgi:gluconolactonase
MAYVTRVVASGLGFLEAPVWTPAQTLLVASASRGLVYEVDVATGEAATACEPGGGLTGLAYDAAGSLWIAQGGPAFRTSSRIRVRAGLQRARGASVRQVLTRDHTPNDCLVTPDGRVWFSDPRGNAFADDPEPGRLCSYDPARDTVEVLAGGLLFPNAIALTPSGDALLVAETAGSRVSRYPVIDGRLGTGEVFARTPGRPDGVAIDGAGDVVVTVVDTGVVLHLDASGATRGETRLEPDSFPTNACFGGDGSHIFVTGARGGRIYQLT